MNTTPGQKVTVDTIEAGSGPVVVLVHSSAADARQWRALIDDLQNRYRIIAVNLFGYGATPAWAETRSQTLSDQAQLIKAALPDNDEPISLVGHSFGACVAMKAAGGLRGRVNKLILLEPNSFYLLDRHGRYEAFAECTALCNWMKRSGAQGDWASAAERFSRYWGGAGTWDSMFGVRRSAYGDARQPNFFEWDAVMDEPTALNDWVRILPTETLVVTARHTVQPIREITELMRAHCPNWRFAQVAQGGHMAPMIRPDLVNPIIAAHLDGL